MHTNYLQPFKSDQEILNAAANIIAEKYIRQGTYCSPDATKEYLTYKLAGYDREVFAVMLLDNQHQLIDFQELFFGTIDSASVYPREVLKTVLQANAAAVIFAHNHPSGCTEPSNADKQLTQKLTNALSLIDVRVLDHIVVGSNAVSFAELGLM